MTAGQSLTTETSEHIHLLTALAYYSRYRFTTNLLPLIKRGSKLRRVVTIGKGGFEGQLDPSDFPASRVPLRAIRGHICTLVSLGLESVAKMAPEVSFIHGDPGAVKTSLLDRMEGVVGVLEHTYLSWATGYVCRLRSVARGNCIWRRVLDIRLRVSGAMGVLVSL